MLSGAGYNRARLNNDRAYRVNRELHYLPIYSLNLNAIERLWKVMNEHARNNRYLSKNNREFRDGIVNFFATTLPEIADSSTTQIYDRFQGLNLHLKVYWI
ncbi:hypothetical protein EH207_11655 [Brenneria rubrifaciens]|uniref:Tc1-like transposase DDE domain-containing protein n=1 Tax=Brenneria rubrifaciens TaxID=55213 RepID=A0A4V1F9X8_9GAMM|nr:hypothetical protein EH207_11655 [Brenneria rubrifaciens]